MADYYTISKDGRDMGMFDRVEKDLFVQDEKRHCHILNVARYNENHLNVGLEQYLDGRLIYAYKE